MIYRIFIINLLDVVFILYIYCVNLENLMKTIMNRQPETATDDPLLQPAVFAVLQSRSTGKVKFLQDGKNCRLQMAVFICRNPQKRAS